MVCLSILRGDSLKESFRQTQAFEMYGLSNKDVTATGNITDEDEPLKLLDRLWFNGTEAAKSVCITNNSQ
jgi:hypothetical protein